MPEQVLIRFNHGLGDAVQWTVVLKHLARYRPDWVIDMYGLRGKETAWRGLCRTIYHDQGPEPVGPYDRVVDVAWWENYNGNPDRPNTKITNCLEETFGIPYDPALGRYTISPLPEDYTTTAAYLESVGCFLRNGRFNAVVIHYQGNTSVEKKNLSHDDMLALCVVVKTAGYVPVILDWDGRTPLVSAGFAVNPGVYPDDPWGGFGSGDAARITAMIAQASLFVGIDSGPGKCASATDTPSIICWTGHHPVQFHDPAPNTVHLIPDTHLTIPPAHLRGPAEYFQHHYQYTTYPAGGLGLKLLEMARERLGMESSGPIQLHGFTVPAHHPEQSLVIIDDVYLRDAYRTKLRPVRHDVEYVIDVGANIGAFARLWHERNPCARIACVEVLPELIPSLTANVGEYAAIIPKACRYASEPLYLLNSFAPAGRSTGGSRVVSRDEWRAETDPQYVKEPDPVPTITLEEICRQLGFPRIDVLKLDCEGSEFDILTHCDLTKIGMIFVESHGAAPWRELLRRRFSGWDIGHISRSACGQFENWHLIAPRP